MQLIVLGVIGEYIGDIHAEVKGRPLYVVGELENFTELPELPPRAVVARPRPRPTRRPPYGSEVQEHEDRQADICRPGAAGGRSGGASTTSDRRR